MNTVSPLTWFIEQMEWSRCFNVKHTKSRIFNNNTDIWPQHGTYFYYSGETTHCINRSDFYQDLTTDAISSVHSWTRRDKPTLHLFFSRMPGLHLLHHVDAHNCYTSIIVNPLSIDAAQSYSLEQNKHISKKVDVMSGPGMGLHSFLSSL